MLSWLDMESVRGGPTDVDFMRFLSSVVYMPMLNTLSVRQTELHCLKYISYDLAFQLHKSLGTLEGFHYYQFWGKYIQE
jgi:hypothetical protein